MCNSLGKYVVMGPDAPPSPRWKEGGNSCAMRRLCATCNDTRCWHETLKIPRIDNGARLTRVASGDLHSSAALWLKCTFAAVLKEMNVLFPAHKAPRGGCLTLESADTSPLEVCSKCGIYEARVQATPTDRWRRKRPPERREGETGKLTLEIDGRDSERAKRTGRGTREEPEGNGIRREARRKKGAQHLPAEQPSAARTYRAEIPEHPEVDVRGPARTMRKGPASLSEGKYGEAYAISMLRATPKRLAEHDSGV
ncbi:hypothetical protein FB451DRAFT_1196741 [Mycena latifolia]|nr:hypothetical protein FB451DRAFT_1196741 [Mycena latifolia]